MARLGIYAVLVSAVCLCALGLVMLFSTGAFAADSRGDMYFFVKRQALWLFLGTGVAVAVALVDYRVWEKLWPYVFGLAVVLLVLCFVPPIGMRINGSWRWINLGFATFQPSELAKVAAVLFLARWFSQNAKKARTFLWGFLIPGMVVGVLMVLIALEVDIGTTALIGAVMLGMMFIGGTGFRWLTPLMALGLAGGLYLAMNIDQRARRLMAFLNPEEFRQAEGLQQWQALIALGSGGIDGLGLGEGRQKMLYLPYAHTDFIFPMIGEELGLRVTLLVVALYLVLCLGGFWVAARARERFGMLVAAGGTLCITLQAAVNIGVTTSLLPNKGMPLPFISYGGSNLLVCLMIVGLLAGIHRLSPEPEPADDLPAVDHRPVLRW